MTGDAASGRTTKRSFFGPLERRVFLVAIAGLLPLAILSCATLIFTAADQKERLLSAHEQTMLAVITAVDSELRSTIAALQSIATRPSLRTGDMDSLHVEARLLLDKHPGWRNFVVSTPEAQQVLNAALPVGSALPSRIAPEAVRTTAATQRPSIGDVTWSALLNEYAVPVQVPYVENGVTKYVLTAVVRPESFLPLLRQQRVPADGVIVILDRELHFVTRSLDAAQWVGKTPSAGLHELMRQGGAGGWAKSDTLEGLPVYSIFHRSSFSGWSAAVGLPQHRVDAPIMRSYLIMAAAIAVSVLLGLLAAVFAGRTIVRPIRELRASAAQMGRGERPLAPQTDLPEIAAVGVALAAAHSEREELFAREREARIAAENANKAKDEFVAMLGHELRNPLAAITNASLLLSRQASALPPGAASAAAIIQRQASHLSRLTDDLLDAGRVILGKIVLTRAPLDLAELVRTVTDGFRTTGRLAQHQFSMEVESVWVNGDPTRLEQVITNLLSNAVRYTPQDGRIAVRVQARDSRARLEVEDTGVGMMRELMPKVFDLFVQGERTIDRPQSGLGIGLTLVKRLTELHGGAVHAWSDGPGMGSKFTVELPAIPAITGRAEAIAPASGGAARILLVEDNDDTRSTLRALLEQDGHTVFEAAEGLSALELIRCTERLDVALLDIGLPALDGYDLVRRIRAERGRAIYCVAMSGYGANADKAKGLEAGFDEYLVKPVDPTALQIILGRLGRAAREAEEPMV